MSCYRPAEFVFVKPSKVDSTLLKKGVPQVDQSIFLADTFHAPPAEAVSAEVFAPYPAVDERPLPRVPLFYTPIQKEQIRASNYQTIQTTLASVPDGGQSKVPPARKQDARRGLG